MRRRLSAALLLVAALFLMPAAPAQAVCNMAPNNCARIVHSVNSQVQNLSVSRVWPAQAGYLNALARGTAGTFAGVYVPNCYQALVSDNYYGNYKWLRGWHSVGVLLGSVVVTLQYIC